MKVDIWMPLYISDYLSDTTRLTCEQSGAYLHLIMDYWKSGPLPDNDQVLASICKLSPDAWSNAKAMLKDYFEIKNGQWFHQRIDEELKTAKNKKEATHQRAVAGANARWKKEDATSNASSIPVSNAPRYAPTPTPISSNRLNEEVIDTPKSPSGKLELQNKWLGGLFSKTSILNEVSRKKLPDLVTKEINLIPNNEFKDNKAAAIERCDQIIAKHTTNKQKPKSIYKEL